MNLAFEKIKILKFVLLNAKKAISSDDGAPDLEC
jgi:hypothetical protein